MSDPTPTAPATDAPTDPAAGGKPQTKPETDWQAKFEAQQKVNRDLEAKFNGLRDAQAAQTQELAKALGIKPEEAPDVSVLAATVATLQEQFSQSQLDNTVLSIARDHGITEQSDVDLLKAVKDEATMRTIAARIAATNAGVGQTPLPQPGPRPDLTQGASGAPASGSPAQDFANVISGLMNGR